MEEKLITKKNELMKELLELYYKKSQEPKNTSAKLFHDLINNNVMNHDSLMSLYLAIQNRSTELADKESKLTYNLDNEICILKYKEKQESFPRRELLRLLSDLVELTEEVLPLGSLVKLKKEYFQDNLDISKFEELRIVITHRFLKTENNSYYTYGGVIYPVANFNSGQILKFTPSLIERILHRGFQDEQEDSYVYLMKKEYIIDKEIHSAGFMSGEGKNEC